MKTISVFDWFHTKHFSLDSGWFGLCIPPYIRVWCRLQIMKLQRWLHYRFSWGERFSDKRRTKQRRYKHRAVEREQFGEWWFYKLLLVTSSFPSPSFASLSEFSLLVASSIHSTRCWTLSDKVEAQKQAYCCNFITYVSLINSYLRPTASRVWIGCGAGRDKLPPLDPSRTVSIGAFV